MDLGFSDAAEREAKLRVAYALNQVLDGRKRSQAEAANVLGVTQPRVSALRHYKLAGFSVERLMKLLTALDQDVEIVIRPSERDLSFRRQSGMAAGKDEPEAVVLDFLILVRRLVDARLEVEREVFLCAVEPRPPAHSVYSFEARAVEMSQGRGLSGTPA
jgi:predicted XRE-type DNA-binding protein